MRYSSQIKPISYVKANAAELISQLERDRQPLVITQNGEAKAVLQDIVSFEQTQETLALLKILALGNQQFANQQVEPFDEVISRIKNKHRAAE
jgi:prevent-host-death family protein